MTTHIPEFVAFYVQEELMQVEGRIWTSSGLNAFELAHVFAHKIDEGHLSQMCSMRLTITSTFSYLQVRHTVLIPKG
jgi:hypothetical protein